MARYQVLLILALVSMSLSGIVAKADDVHKATIEQNEMLAPAQQYVPSYGAPKMVGPVPQHKHPQPMQPKLAKPAEKPPEKHLKATATIENIKKPPLAKQNLLKAAPVQVGVLPAQFLGRWQVMGSRSNVEAQPQFQKGIDGIFAMTTTNTWTIQGSPEQGYMLSTDSGVTTPLSVQTQGSTAILRYQHPIRNTVAQEALVMQLIPGGVQFDGMERITIIKQGEPPRAKVTYKLIGHRQ